MVLFLSRDRVVAPHDRSPPSAGASSTALPQNSTGVEFCYLKTRGDSSKGPISEGVLRRSPSRACEGTTFWVPWHPCLERNTRTYDPWTARDGYRPTQGRKTAPYVTTSVACKVHRSSDMLRINWTGRGALLRLTSGDHCDWTYCGGGPSFRNVKRTHFVAALESLLGWDHPAAQEARDFCKDAK